MPDEHGLATPISDTAPCVGCGLCCDGTIYDKARAQPHEVERMTALGLATLEDQGKLHFQHPCRFSSEGKCTIYDDRFTICHTFKCKLLTAYQAGDIGLDEARDKIGQALRLRSVVAAEEPAAARHGERRRLLAELAQTSRRVRLQLDIVALDFFIDRWFRKDKSAARGSVTIGPD